MVTKDTPCLTLNTFPDIVKIKFVLLPLDRYPFREVTSKYLPRVSKQNVLSETIAGNVSIVR